MQGAGPTSVTTTMPKRLRKVLTPCPRATTTRTPRRCNSMHRGYRAGLDVQQKDHSATETEHHVRNMPAARNRGPRTRVCERCGADNANHRENVSTGEATKECGTQQNEKRTEDPAHWTILAENANGSRSTIKNRAGIIERESH